MIDLAPHHLETVRRILGEHVPDCEVRAFGSRAKWEGQDYSDLDLAVVCEDEANGPAVERLKEAFEESDLPIRVDVLDWHAIAEDFRKAIEPDCVVVQPASEPATWREMTVGEFAAFSYGKSLPASRRTNSGQVPVYGSNGITGYHDSSLTDGPTVIIGRKGSAGAVHYSSVSCWPIDTTFFVTGRDAELVRFKYYALSALGLETMNSDSAVPGLNRDAAHAQVMRIPDEPEQRAIAGVLGALDDKIELNRRMSETLEEMARALFRSWFVDFDPVRAKAEGRPSGLPPGLDALFPDRLADSSIGPIPHGWTVESHRDIVYQIRDTVDPRLCPSERFTYFSIPAFDYNRTPLQEYGRSIKSQKLVVQQDSVLVSRLNPEIERVWLADVDNYQRAICSTEFLVIRPTPPFGKSYMYCLARSKTFQDRLKSLVTGTSKSHQRVSATSILSTLALIPPTPIAIAFDCITESLLDRSLACRREADQLAATRNMFLPKLVHGKILVSAP